MNKKESDTKKELPKGVDGTHPGIDRERNVRTLSNQFQVWDGLAQDWLCQGRVFIFS